MKDFVVRVGGQVIKEFHTYYEAFAFWKVLTKRHPGAVIQDNSK